MKTKQIILIVTIASCVSKAEMIDACKSLVGKYSTCSIVKNSSGWKPDFIQISKKDDKFSFTEASFGTSETKTATDGVTTGSIDYIGEVFQIIRIDCLKNSLVIKEKSWPTSWGSTEPTDKAVSVEGQAELNIVKIFRINSKMIMVQRSAEQMATNTQSYTCN